MTIEELRKMLIEVIKNLDNYTDRELVEIQCIGDKLKEMAMYESFLREKGLKESVSLSADYQDDEENYPTYEEMQEWERKSAIEDKGGFWFDQD